MSKKLMLRYKIEEESKKEPNTFVINGFWFLVIQLCLKCAKIKEKLSKAVKCEKCGRLFIPNKSKICPNCWALIIAKGGNNGGNN